MSPSNPLSLLSPCLLGLGSPSNCRNVDPLRRTCALSFGGDGGEFENASTGRRPCSSYIFSRLATEGSCRSLSRRLVSLGVIGKGVLLERFRAGIPSCGRDRGTVYSLTWRGVSAPISPRVGIGGLACGNSVRAWRVRPWIVTVYVLRCAVLETEPAGVWVTWLMGCAGM
jgi:hypothetical protein